MLLDPRNLLSKAFFYRWFQGLIGREEPWKRFVESLDILPGQRVLDIGCGPASILAQLPNGIEYFGLDNNPNYIEEAQAKYGSRGTFIVRSISAELAKEFGQFDTILAIGVLHHLDDAGAEALLAAASKVLKPDGKLVSFDGVFFDGQNPIAKFLLYLDRGRFVRTSDAYENLAKRYFPKVKGRFIHDLLAVPYSHFVMECKLRE